MSDDRFEEFKAAYPRRAGGQGWIRAAQLCRQLVDSGDVTWDDLIGGATRYAAYCRAVGSERTPFVLQARTFVGPNQWFGEDWDLPADNSGPRILTEEQKREVAITRDAQREGLTRAPGESLDSFSDRVRRAYIARIGTPVTQPSAAAGPTPVRDLLRVVR